MKRKSIVSNLFEEKLIIAVLSIVVGNPVIGFAFPAESQTSVQSESEMLQFKEFESGEVRTVKQYEGKIVVLNFWATWCKPCLEEMPLLDSIQKLYGEKGVQVIAVSADQKETQSNIKPFLQKFGIDLPVWLGGTTEKMVELGLGHALPATAIMDRTGNVVGRIIGKATETDLNNYIDWLLEAPPDSINKLSNEAGQRVDENEHEHEHQHESNHEHVELEGASSVPS